ncbi:replicative DNA helicase [Streptomyces filamentosus]
MSITQEGAPHSPEYEEPWQDVQVPAARQANPMERVPPGARPEDIEAEQSVLGGMLLSKDAIGDVVEALKGPDLYKPRHETIFEAILALYAKGEPADPITVAAELTKRGQINRVGGASYLHELVQAVPSAANAAYYAEIVHEQAVLRRLVEAGTKITQLGYAAEGEAIDIVASAHVEMSKVLSDQVQRALPTPLSATAGAIADRIQERKTRGKGLRGLPTGFRDLDDLTNGLVPGQLIIVAARPAMGKSTFAIDISRACSVARQIPTAFFSLEMSRDDIEDRILSAEARVGLHKIQSGNVSDEDWERIARRMGAIGEAPLFIDETDEPSFMELAAKAHRLKEQHDIKLLTIDYLQLMKSGGRAENRQQEVSDISRNLKLLAKSLRIPVIALSQLNRGPEHRTDKKPMVSDLRESGAIEQDADMVILLHREDAYEKESPRAGEADIIVGKHRNGPTATITVAFQGHYSRFVDMAQT